MSIAPRVTVIMPVYNGESFLGEAIASVLSQTYSDLELIVVNDGSTDRSTDVIESYRRRDTRVLHIDEGRRGFVASLNRGVELARGQYVARMDADDISLPHRLAEQVAFLDANPGIAACGGAINVFTAHEHSSLRFPAGPAAVRVGLLFNCCLSHPTVILRKADLVRHNISYREPYGGTADYDLWCQLDRSELQLANLPSALLRYRRHAAQITTSDADHQLALANRIRREQLAHYNVFPNPMEFDLHCRLGRWDYARMGDNLPLIATWLERLHEHLAVEGRICLKELVLQLATHWYAVCAANTRLGLGVVRAFRSSHLGRRRMLSALRLTARAVVSQVRSRG
jgi:glycosyltransferase involved in cell wall biosynthesis